MPNVQSITPSSGTTGGGTPVTIKGTGFLRARTSKSAEGTEQRRRRLGNGNHGHDAGGRRRP